MLYLFLFLVQFFLYQYADLTSDLFVKNVLLYTLLK